MTPAITTMTLSVEISEKDYGKGGAAFINMSAKYPGEGLPIGELDSAVDDSLDMFLKLWESITAQRYAAGIIKADELKITLANLRGRIHKVKAYLEGTREQTI